MEATFPRGFTLQRNIAELNQSIRMVSSSGEVPVVSAPYLVLCYISLALQDYTGHLSAGQKGTKPSRNMQRPGAIRSSRTFN